MSLLTTAARTLQKLLYTKGPYRIWLVRSSSIDADGNSDAYEGFAKANQLSFDLEVRRDHGEGDITVSIEHSDDGDTWAELVAAETTTGNQTVTLTAEAPWNDQIRVVWDVTDAAVWRVWVRANVGASFVIGDVEEAGPGGSQPGAMRLEDLGVLDSTLRGTDAVFTPDAGETVVAVLITDSAGVDSQQICLGTAAQLQDVVDEADPDFSAARTSGTDGFDSFGKAASVSAPNAITPVTGAVEAGLFMGTAFLPTNTDWQANHVYDPGAIVVALLDQGEGPVPTIFQTSGGGTSGGTEPVWQVNPDPTVDGTVSWDDLAVLDQTLTCHAYALVAAALS